MTFKSNEFLVVHDSEDFGVGDIDRLQIVTRFITSRFRRERLEERLRVIWYLNVYIYGYVRTKELMFLGTACQRTAMHYRKQDCSSQCHKKVSTLN